MASLRLHLGLAIVLGLAACSQADEWSVRTQNLNVTAATQQLIQKMISAPTTISWCGTRRYEAHYTWSGSPVDMAYDELVTTDGRGNFQLEPLDLIQPDVPASEEGLFLLLQGMRQSFMFRHRDAAVRDEAQLYANYDIVDQGNVVQVLGRDCADLTFSSATASNHTWRLLVDLDTGVVLSMQERDVNGALLSAFTYLDFTLDPDTSNAIWHQSLLQESPLDPSAAQQELGFVPRTPKSLPAGYVQIAAHKLVEPQGGSVWARFIYSDGWNEIFFIEGTPQGLQQHLVQGPQVQADQMRYMSIGPWIVADGEISQRRVVVLGRMSEQALQYLVESSL